jgi:ABC-type branched-subunit amino acid transport system substrate-binding protein
MLTKIAFVVSAAALALTFVVPAGATKGHKKHRHARVASNATQVVVPRGHPVEIAYTPDLTGLTSSFATSLGNAVQMAVAAHPVIRGFRVQLNTVDMPCGDSTADGNAAASVVANLQNTAVLGPFCSTADAVGLPTYQSAGVVTLSGSTTDPSLPGFGPDVFNSVIVSDACCPVFVDLAGPWYATVRTFPSDLAWRQAYTSEFGSSPTAFADLYYDAAGLLIRDLQATSRIDGSGNLVINRAALAEAVRSTTKYQGVTCTIALDPTTGFRVNDPAALAGCAED